MKPTGEKELPPIEGVRVRGTRDSYVLIDAKLIQGLEQTHPFGSPVEVPKANVYCVERVG